MLLGMESEPITIRGRRSNLRAGVVALLLLGMPITGWMRSRTLRNLWVVTVCHLALSQVRAVRTAQLRGVPALQHHWQYALFLPYMIVGWVGTALGLIEAILPWRRWRW